MVIGGLRSGLTFLQTSSILQTTSPDASADGCGPWGRIFFMTRKKRATFVYIDGLNLFYRLKKCPHSKWLNLGSFVHSILESKRHEIKKIKYFTARVKKSKKDPSKTMRQDTYLRAIGQLPDLEIIPGQFKMRQVKGVLCPDFAELIQTKTIGTPSFRKYRQNTKNF